MIKYIILKLHCFGNTRIKHHVLMKITALVLALAPLTMLAENKDSQQNTIKVTGIVSDNMGPMAGVSVSVKGTTLGILTNIDGKYELTVNSPKDVLVYSFIGFTKQEIAVGERRQIDVMLEETMHQIEEVVVVGYGVQKKVNLVGSVGTVNVDDQLAGRSVPNVSAGLTGLVPGLAVNQNGGMAGNNNATMIIRGLGTVNSASPLIVVDGMPDVDINRLNMNDIENISVLKDAASSAVYGSRAANGVILITTKTGKKGEKAKISFSGSYGISKPTKSYNFMNDYPRSLTLHQQKAAVNTLDVNQRFQNGTIDQWMAMGMIDPLRYPNTDWWDIITRTGAVQNYNVSASGGNDKSNFYLSVGYMDEKGLQINNDYSRYNARFNFDYKITNNINVGAKFGGSWTKYTYALEEGFSEGSNFDLRYAIAGITPYDPYSGNYGGAMAYGEDMQAYNPLVVYNNMQNRRNRQEANVSGYMDWTPIKGLTGRVEYGLNYYNQFRWSADMPAQAYNFQTENYTSRVYVGKNAGVANYTNTGYKTIFNTRLNYNTKFADIHDVSAMFAYNEEYWYGRSQTSSRSDRTHESLHEVDAALAGDQRSGGNSNTEGLRSYIGRANYAFSERYLLELNFRVDGSSLFLKGHQYGFFPSAAVGWRFSEEDFTNIFTDKWLSNGKLRASYGSLGNNSAVGRYEQKPTLDTGHYMLDGEIAKGFVNKKMINPNLTWEKTTVLNIGLDLGFLNSRLTTEFDYYNRLTTDMIRPSEMSTHLTGAYDAPRKNIGNLRNQGIEANITWRDKIRDFSYMFNFNVSYNQTRLEKWNDFLDKGWIYLDMPYHFTYAYQAIGIAETWEDVYNATPQGASPGDILLKDVNGDGKIDGNDRVAYTDIQRDRPTTNYALSGNFAWKGFDLSFLFQGTYGRKDFWLNHYNNMTFPDSRNALSWEHWNDHWSWDNRNSKMPRLGGSGNNTNESTFWLDDMSYIRLKNIRFGYSLKKDWIRKVGLSNVQIYFSGENIFTLTNYRGLDPEKSGNKNDAYPMVKSYSFGVNIAI